MNGLEAEGRALVADPGDPGAIFGARSDCSTVQPRSTGHRTDRLADGRQRRTRIVARRRASEHPRADARNVEIELIQAVAQLN